MKYSTHHWLRTGAFIGLGLALYGCGRADRPVATSPPPASQPVVPPALPAAETRLESVEVGAAKPVHQFGNYYLAGQPAAADFATWKDKGVRTVISLRAAGEIDWDEKAAVEAQGMKFVSIPFRAADSLGDSQIEAALAALQEGREHPVLLHCGTSHRVGAIWYAHRIRQDGVSPADAMSEAKEVGLRNTALTDVIDAYCEREPTAK